MKIRLLSDLHTEFRLPYKSEPLAQYRGEDVLVLAGDIASGSTNTMEVLKFFKAQGYKKVIYVPGNHEYYGTSIEDFDNKMRAKTSEVEDIHFLNPGVVVYEEVMFIGAALWTNFRDNFFSMKAAQRGINDFRVIKDFSADKAAKLYYKHFEFIKDWYEAREGRRVVIVTHFLPAVECIAPRFRGPDLLNDYFANDLGNYIAGMSDTTWLFGHTHDATDIVLGDTRVIANPHGYYTALNDGIGFDPYKTIEV